MALIEIRPLTAEWLRAVLDYDPKTGLFHWRIDRGGRKARIGALAGSFDATGYIQIMIDGKNYKAHRLAWLYVTGNWPIGDIDHLNGERANNRWSNLREATKSINQQNQRVPQKISSSPFLGVSRRKNCMKNPWTAKIKANGQLKYLGVFATAEEAHRVYLKAKRELHPGCTI